MWRVERPKSHPFTVFGRHFARETSSPHPMISAIFDGAFSRSRRCKRTNKWDDLLELANSLPGYVEVTEQAQTSVRSESLAGMTRKTTINGADDINIVSLSTTS